jgi:mannose-1-phosphate guanylyltransferase
MVLRPATLDCPEFKALIAEICSMLHTLIMAGGGGTRFWPRSRRARPKQFLALAGTRTLLQQALDRIETLVTPERSWVITAATHVGETARQLPALPAGHIIGEPCGRDTAPCIALGAQLIALADPEAVMLVMPADHVIEPVPLFRQALHVGEQMALEHPGALVTFGIPPTFPATGYGYIERGPELVRRQGLGVYRVQRFIEKPSADRAEQLVAAGGYYWNSGLFMWRVATILEALRQHQPALAGAAERIAASWATPARSAVLEREYAALARLSIDYAIMEKAGEVLVVHAPFAWDDVGSWLALERMQPQDAQHNTIQAEHEGIATERCIIVGEPGRLIATAGVKDLVIVQDGNATLVAQRGDESALKKLVEQMQAKKRDSYL